MTGSLQLTLIRHARAMTADIRTTDFDRPLDRRGLAEAAEMARRCRELGHIPDRLVASPALRAVQTADCFVRALELPAAAVRLEPRCYLAEAPQLLEAVRAAPSVCRHLFLVGHNPGLSDLARRLALGGAPAGMETAGLFTLRIDASDWASVVDGAGRGGRYDSPSLQFNYWE
jgi:phosphohistidine phosphatase